MSDLSWSLFDLANLIGFIQGIVFGIVLIVMSSRARPTIYLALLLIAIAIELLPEILGGLGFL